MLQVGAGRRKCKEASEIHKFSTVSIILGIKLSEKVISLLQCTFLTVHIIPRPDDQDGDHLKGKADGDDGGDGDDGDGMRTKLMEKVTSEVRPV